MDRAVVCRRPIDVTIASTETDPWGAWVLITSVVLLPDSEIVTPLTVSGVRLGRNT